MNVKDYYEYTDVLDIRVLDLGNIQIATEQDSPDLIHWAKIFKAKTMKELEELANREELKNMVVTIKQLSEDEKIRQQCEARFWYDCDMVSQYASGVENGIQQGIEQEHVYTELEKRRADDAEREILKLKEELEKIRRKITE